MKEIGYIYLSWRKGVGERRHIIGVLKKNASKGVRFSYIPKNVEKAKKEGFSSYIAFPDLSKEYTENVIEIFGQRLMKSEREDIKDFYDFWEIDPMYKDDKYYMLAHTQGLNPADNFEFLADYHPIKELKFMTDLAGLSKFKLTPNTIKKGDVLEYRLDSKNEKDNKAVNVFKEGQQIGFIKRIHTNVFHASSNNSLKLVVKAVDQNGFIKSIFVRVSY